MYITWIVNTMWSYSNSNSNITYLFIKRRKLIMDLFGHLS